MLLFSSFLFAQEIVREDDLGDISDDFQTSFFEAIKQKGIENYDKAITLLVKCKDQEPQNAAVYFELAKNYLELNKYQLAESALIKANELKPNNEWVLNMMCKLYKITQKDDKIIETLLKLGKFNASYKNELVFYYFRNQKYKSALDLIDELDVIEGIVGKRENLRYKIYDYQKKHKEQIVYINSKIKNGLGSQQDYSMLIYTYSILKNNEKGYEVAEIFKDAYPKSSRPYYSLYKYYHQQGRVDEAIQAMHFVMREYGDIANKQKAKVLNDFYDFTVSNLQYLPELEKALKVYPNKEVLNKMVVFYETNNEIEKADQIVSEITATTSNKYEDLIITTALLLRKNKFNEVLEITLKALELYPAQPIFYLQQAKALLGNKKASEALENLEMGIDFIIDDNVLEANFFTEMAKAYLLLGDSKKHQQYLKKGNQ